MAITANAQKAIAVPKTKSIHPLLLPVFGLVFGASMAAGILASGEWLGMTRKEGLGWMAASALLGVIFIYGLRAMVRFLVKTSLGGLLPEGEYERRDTLTYAVFMLAMATGLGIQVSITSVYILVLGFAVAQALYFFSIYRRTPEGGDFFISLGWLTLLFLISGMAALIYEIVWQRVLFAAYGVNIESITIIVSLFMFGLGVGSLIGGFLSARYPSKLPQLFVICEMAIGLFGLLSLPVIHFVAAKTLHLPLSGITLAIYALLALPTMFMGATLPILVTHLHRTYRNIGKSVGKLYFFNTLGSALACLLTVDVIFVFMGKQATVTVAALLNFSVAILVLVYIRKHARTRLPEREDGVQPAPVSKDLPAVGSIPFALVLVVSALAGFLSLSQEILWIRAVSYIAQGAPQVFGHVLGFFLIGIAFGARQGERFCEKGRMHPLTYIAGLFLAGAVFYYFCIPIFANATVLNKGLGLILSYFTVSVVAFIFGNVLPILSHYGIRPGRPVGQSLSWVYMANIAGATAGPLLTGFFLMDRFTFQENVLYISVASVFFAVLIILTASVPMRFKAGFLATSALAVVLLVAVHSPVYANIFEKLRYGPRYAKKPRHNHIIQNRSGIIAVEPSEKGDIIFGGGGYDGRFSMDPVLNSNGIRRAFMIAGLHPNPSEVLEIGLSTGSWAWVLAAYEKVQKLDIVEINPGYPKVISVYDERHQSVLTNPKITIHFDDGRRWLRRNPGRKFDFILMNTTFHWRSNITNLVSQDFLEMAKSHLKPGGVIYYNTTGSQEIIYTAAKVFRHVTTFSTFVAASDRPFRLTPEEKRENFLRFMDEGRPVFSPKTEGSEMVLEEMVAADISDKSHEFLERKDLRVITDDNMLTEFKRISDSDAIGYLYRWYNAKATWASGWRRFT